MSLLHPDEWDNEMAESHTQKGWNKAVRRCMNLRSLLSRARDVMGSTTELAIEIDLALTKSFYDESEETPPNWLGKT
jgi:hypothetical protein